MNTRRFQHGTALLSILLVTVAVASAGQAPPPTTQPLDAFFDSFADEWMRRRPSASTGSRYFEGETQAASDRQEVMREELSFSEINAGYSSRACRQQDPAACSPICRCRA